MIMNKDFIRIGIHLPNKKIGNGKFSNPEEGNPGIGGTQFLLWSLPYYMNKFSQLKFEFIFFVEDDAGFSKDYKSVKIKGLWDIAQKAIKEPCDVLIYRPAYNKENLEFLDAIKKTDLKVVAWLHNTPIFLLNKLAGSKNIRRCICVGREQYEKLRDHLIINKLFLIYNGIDTSVYPNGNNTKKKKKVTFLGSIEFAKGFHLFARMWKDILEVHPDAELHVIGSGKLYNENIRIGDLGIAEERYEEVLKKFLCDEEGKLLDSVKFHGLLGKDKFNIMSEACVGLTNHPYVSETFCLAAAEFQLCGTPVVSRANGGLLDTVSNGQGGFLEKNLLNIKKKIIYLLSNLDISDLMGQNGSEYIRSKFNYNEIIINWEQMIDDVLKDNPVDILPLKSNDKRTITQIREALRKLKKLNGLFKTFIPTIYFVHTIEFVRLKFEKLRFKI